MSEPKSLLDRIGDALKPGADQKSEAHANAQEVVRTLPDRAEAQAQQAASAAQTAATQAVAQSTDTLQRQISDLRSMLLDKERELAQKSGVLAQRERELAQKTATLAQRDQQIVELQAALKNAQDEAAHLREQTLVSTRSVAAVAPARVYVVKAGDSLSAIAKTVYGNANRWPEIFEANKDLIKDPKLIRPGQQLRIP